MAEANRSRAVLLRQLDKLALSLQEWKKHLSDPLYLSMVGELRVVKNKAQACFANCFEDAGLLAESAYREVGAMEFKGSPARRHVKTGEVLPPECLDIQSEISAKKNVDRMIELSEVVREALVASVAREALVASAIASRVGDVVKLQPAVPLKKKLPPKQQDLSMYAEYFDRAHLTDKQRQYVLLEYEYGLNPHRIAKHLGKHRSTVREVLDAAHRRMNRLKSTERPT
jgi:hypothetical protein